MVNLRGQSICLPNSLSRQKEVKNLQTISLVLRTSFHVLNTPRSWKHLEKEWQRKTKERLKEIEDPLCSFHDERILNYEKRQTKLGMVLVHKKTKNFKSSYPQMNKPWYFGTKFVLCVKIRSIFIFV